MIGPFNENNRKENSDKAPGQTNDQAANDEALTLPDRGPLLAEGAYLVTEVDANGEPTRAISAGPAQCYADGIVATERLGETMLSALGVKTLDDVERALHGDSGQPTNSSTTVGWNKKYAQGWDNLWGSSSN